MSAKQTGVDAVSTAALRFSFAALVMVALLWACGDPLTLPSMRRSMAGGLAIGVEVVLSFTALQQTTVVNVGVITAMQPVVVLGIAYVAFGERPGGRNVLLGTVALACVLVVVASSSGSPEWHLRGDLVAFAAVGCFSLYLAMARHTAVELNAAHYTAATAVWGALVAVPLAFAVEGQVTVPAGSGWGWLAFLVIGAGVVGHQAMNWSLRHIPFWVGSSVILLLPVGAALMAWMVLDEALTRYQVLAMAGVVLALGAMARPRVR